MTGIMKFHRKYDPLGKQLQKIDPISNYFLAKSDKKHAEAEKPEPADPVMPTIDDDAIKNARRRSLAAQMQRRGRGSTLLSQNSGGTLGG